MNPWHIAVGYFVLSIFVLVLFATLPQLGMAIALVIILTAGGVFAWILARRLTAALPDVTKRKEVEEALRLSEERFSLALQAAEEGHFDVNLETDEIFLSARVNEIYGFPRQSTVMSRSEFVKQIPLHPEDRDRVLAELARPKLPTDLHELEGRIFPRPGEMRWVHSRAKVVFDAEGRPRRRVGVVADITERKLTEESLRLSEERYALALEASEEGHFDNNLDTGEIFVSARLNEIYGFSAQAEVANRLEYISRIPFHPDDRERVIAQLEMTNRPGASNDLYEIECRVVPRLGETRWIHSRAKVVRDANGRPRRRVGVVEDVTARRRIEGDLRSRQEILELALKAAGAAFFEWRNDANPEENTWSPEMCAMFGLPPGGFNGIAASWKKLCFPEDWPHVKDSIARAIATGEINVEYRVRHPDGKMRWLNCRGRAFVDEHGRPTRSIGFMFDVTERRKVEDELRSRQDMLDLAQKAARSVAYEWKLGVGARENRWSPDLEAMYGLALGTHDGTDEAWMKLIHPDDQPTAQKAIHHAWRTGEIDFEYRVVHPDGSVHWLHSKGRMLRDDAGKPDRLVGFMLDITQRKRAEEELRRLEEELRRAQRLESIGTLAGGIAHDFNNILGAILGFGEMALRKAKPGTRMHRDVDAIMAAGERGRALVDRILAFSRSGVGERVPVHVEAVVREVLDQIAASVPGNVKIMPHLHAGRAAMLGDSTQVHQVVMNLASNAVQAMSGGGMLHVFLETERIDGTQPATVGAVLPGEYVVLTFRDSGPGIAEGVLERMFDPFFTTKEVGVGCGLGLSLVHGIVMSVGGAIDVETDLGKGTTFTVYLPRSSDAVEKAADQNRAPPRGKGQRVIVVDDEEPLVRLAMETLKNLGYRPSGFTSSSAALAAFRADPNGFDAVLTDERMPEITGTALIREVRSIRGAIPIILMSGYLGMENQEADVVVRKPLSANDLAASMARVLSV